MRKNHFLWRSVASARRSALLPFQNQDQDSYGNQKRRRIWQYGRFLGLAPAAAMSNSPSIDVARQALRVAKHFVETNRLPAFALGAGSQFERVVHARASIIEGGRSGKRLTCIW